MGMAVQQEPVDEEWDSEAVYWVARQQQLKVLVELGQGPAWYGRRLHLEDIGSYLTNESNWFKVQD